MCATVSLMGHTYVYQESNIKLNIFDLLLLNYIIYKRVCVRVCACVCACVCVIHILLSPPRTYRSCLGIARKNTHQPLGLVFISVFLFYDSCPVQKYLLLYVLNYDTTILIFEDGQKNQNLNLERFRVSCHQLRNFKNKYRIVTRKTMKFITHDYAENFSIIKELAEKICAYIIFSRSTTTAKITLND